MRIASLQGLRVGTAEAYGEVPPQLQGLYDVLDKVLVATRNVLDLPIVDRIRADQLQQPSTERMAIAININRIEGQWFLGQEFAIEKITQQARLLVAKVFRENASPEDVAQYRALRTALVNLLDPSSNEYRKEYKELNKALDVLNEPMRDFLYSAEQIREAATRAQEERVAVISRSNIIQGQWKSDKRYVIEQITEEARALSENPSPDAKRDYRILQSTLIELLNPNSGYNRLYDELKDALDVPSIEDRRAIIEEYHGRTAEDLSLVQSARIGGLTDRATDLTGKFWSGRASHEEIIAYISMRTQYDEVMSVGGYEVLRPIYEALHADDNP